MTIAKIIDFLNEHNIEYDFRGNADTCIEGYSTLERYKAGSFTWIKSEDYIPQNVDVSCIELAFSRDCIGAVRNNIVVSNPKEAFFATIESFYGDEQDNSSYIGHNTYISPDVKIGENVRIGHNCSLDGKIIVGDNTVIGNNVSITGKVEIGYGCEIQSGTIIGTESVTYVEDADHIKTIFKQYGGVKIGNNVRIQALSRVARGSIDDTVIMDRAIIGGGSEISHNCYIGENATLLPYGILCGSVTIGDDSYISGAHIKNHVKIGKGAFVGFGSVVVKDVADYEEVWGFPARRMQIKK